MTILEKGKYRIQTIARIDSKEAPILEGLAIEKNCGDGSYYVICFIKYINNKVKLEMVEDYIWDVGTEDWKLFLNLSKAAMKLVEVANIK